VLINGGRGRYAWTTILPMLFVIATTVTAAKSMIGGRFWDLLQTGIKEENWQKIMQGGLNIGVTVLLLLCLTVIVASAIVRWIFVLRGEGPNRSDKPLAGESPDA
jgi:carbon starvation protein